MRYHIPLILLAATLVGCGLACKKPEPLPAPKAAADDAKSRAEEARLKAEAETRRQQEEARRKAEAEAKEKAEAARRVEEAKAYQRAAEAALKEIHFEYDQAGIREEDKPILQGIADFLKQYPTAKLSIEGHCDERGTVEYNLALGERRASGAKAFLKGLGAREDRLATISYGKERPKVKGKDEESYLANRRCEFKLQ